MSRLISVEEIEGGMVLATAVKNRYGQVLLGANVTLETKHKAMFKTWGVTMLNIIDSDHHDVEISITAAMREGVVEKLLARLQWSPENPHEQDLFDMALRSMIEKSS